MDLLVACRPNIVVAGVVMFSMMGKVTKAQEYALPINLRTTALISFQARLDHAHRIAAILASPSVNSARANSTETIVPRADIIPRPTRSAFWYELHE